MGLIAELQAEREQGTSKGPTCTVCRLLATLPNDEATALATALDDPAVTGTGIARALHRSGHRIAHGTIHRHRRGECVGAP